MWRRRVEPDGADRAPVVSGRHVARHADDPAESDRAEARRARGGAATWTFEVVPQTESADVPRNHPVGERVARRSRTTASTAIIPGNTPPAQISTQGDYNSPRGCRGSFGSFGVAEATRIEADFTGVDCPVTFTGSVVLTKQ